MLTILLKITILNKHVGNCLCHIWYNNENSWNWLLTRDIFQVTIKQVANANDWSQNKLRNVHCHFQSTKGSNLLINSIYNFLFAIKCSFLGGTLHGFVIMKIRNWLQLHILRNCFIAFFIIPIYNNSNNKKQLKATLAS